MGGWVGGWVWVRWDTPFTLYYQCSILHGYSLAMLEPLSPAAVDPVPDLFFGHAAQRCLRGSGHLRQLCEPRDLVALLLRDRRVVGCTLAT